MNTATISIKEYRLLLALYVECDWRDYAFVTDEAKLAKSALDTFYTSETKENE